MVFTGFSLRCKAACSWLSLGGQALEQTLHNGLLSVWHKLWDAPPSKQERGFGMYFSAMFRDSAPLYTEQMAHCQLLGLLLYLDSLPNNGKLLPSKWAAETTQKPFNVQSYFLYTSHEHCPCLPLTGAESVTQLSLPPCIPGWPSTECWTPAATFLAMWALLEARSEIVHGVVVTPQTTEQLLHGLPRKAALESSHKLAGRWGWSISYWS